MLIGENQDGSQHYIPEDPKNESSFLTFPEAGYHVVNRKSFRAVRIRIKVFEAVIIDDFKK